ncbi:hypothetical protein DFH06DRAFT_1100396 [Mycena polygramma]|nr:hypothetical protein DFH06DRAFT_1100396 [Mycena polygramma]
MFPSRRALLAALFTVTASVSSTPSFPAGTPSGVGCVDPQGLVDCYSSNVDQATSCVASAKNTCSGDNLDVCEVGCANYQLAANVGCWLQHCWNQVYSCDFQATVVTYIDTADRIASTVDIPFYPPPTDAPGGCSCNLGQVYELLSEAAIAEDPCIAYVNDGTAVAADCTCCMLSAPISNIIHTCPKSDLSLLSVSTLIQSLAKDAQQDSPDSCKSALGSNNTCASQFNITIDDGATYLNPAALPSGVPGSEPLSTLSGSVTTLPGPQTITLELFPGYSSVIALASFDAQKVTQTAPPTASPTSTGGSQSKPNGGSRMRMSWAVILAISGSWLFIVA